MKEENKYYCNCCNYKEKVYRLFDIDGQNLEEFLICLSCGDGKPYIFS